MKHGFKLATLYAGSFVISIAPLAAVIGVNFGRYTATRAGGFSLAIGGIVIFLITLLKALGRLPKAVNRTVRYGVAFVLVCLLEPIIFDLKLIVGAAFLGELLDVLIFPYLISREKRRHNEKNIASAVREELSNSSSAGGRT